MARDYAKLFAGLWTGETGKKMRGEPHAFSVAGYLIGGPSSNMIGLYRIEIPLIAHHLGIPSEGASKALQSLSEAGFAHYDETTETVWLVEGARHQIGESLKLNDNQIKWIHRQLHEMRHSPFFSQFIEKYGVMYHLDLKSLRRVSEGPSKGLTDPLRSQLTDTVTVTVKKKELPAGKAPAVSSREAPVLKPPKRTKKTKSPEKPPSEFTAYIDRCCKAHHGVEAVELEGAGNSWAAWGKGEFKALADARTRIGQDEAERRWAIFLADQDDFYRGHLPTLFLRFLGKFIRASGNSATTAPLQPTSQDRLHRLTDEQARVSYQEACRIAAHSQGTPNEHIHAGLRDEYLDEMTRRGLKTP